ncbi:MAG TPA: glycosyltransferase [Polyangiaceae bacterium]
MARAGYSPATRVFEAAGAGACMVSDEWDGIERFFEPGLEILVAKDSEEVARYLLTLTPEKKSQHRRCRAATGPCGPHLRSTRL